VHAVGAAFEREVGAVVHEQERAMAPAERRELAPGRHHRPVRGLLVPELDHVHTAPERGLHHVDGRGLEDQVQARMPQGILAGSSRHTSILAAR
jgi:hypothetical protein